MVVPSREVVASWKRLVECSPTALVATEGPQHRLVYTNPTFQRFCGQEADALLDRPLDTVLPPVRLGSIRALLDRVHASGAAETIPEVEYAAVGGEPAYWRFTARPILAPQGSVEGLLVQVTDTTDQELLRRHHEQLLAQIRTISQALLLSNLRAQEAVDAAELAEQRVRKLLAGLDAIIWEADATLGRFSFVSDQAQYLLGYPLERWYTDPEFWPSILHSDNRDLILASCRERIREAEDFDFECQVLTADGRTVWLQSFVRVTPGSGPEAPQLCGVTVEITTQKLLAKQLERQAFSDGLTALPNRTLFLERLQHALQRRERHGKEVAVFFLDLDGFKRVNDALGHAAGDELLQEVSRRLLSGLRDEDTLARFGGDEFAILLEDETNTTDAIRVAQRLLTQLLAPFLIQRREVLISASIGIAVSSPTASGTEALLRNADEALYQAKATGKGQWIVFDQPMQTAAVQRLQLETDLYHAEERGQLRVHYQSEVDLETGEIVGVEALLRWQHPEQGLLLPVEFLPVAEELGMILPMGRWVRREAFRQVRRWNVDRSQPLTLSVNLCAREFQDPHLPEEIQGLLASAGSEPGLLRLELTETTLLDNVELAAQRIAALQQPGVEFALDDFGTGYSSLGYLRQLPVQVLKIDRSFIQELADDETSRTIMRAITEMGHALQMQLTAEGIETRAQHQAVQQTTCARGQGYYFSRPVDAEEMGQLLASPPTLEAPGHLPPWHERLADPMKAPFSPAEADRLKALQQYDILDTAPEQEFDDLTHLAALICGTPLSALIFVDQERLWLKSRVGMSTTEIPRNASICAQAILGKDLLLVPDASADRRFADDPFVLGEPHLRFYAGMPLVTPEGYAVGTLCVFDRVPRQLAPPQQDALRRLGRQAVALLEGRSDATTDKGQSRQFRQQSERQRLLLATESARRDAKSTRASEVRYRRLFEAAKDGILILDATTGQIEEVNPFLCQLLDYDRDCFIGKQLWEIGAFRDIAANEDAFQTLQQKEYIRYSNLPLETREGQSVCVEFVSNVYRCADKKVIQCNIRDNTVQRQAVLDQERFFTLSLGMLCVLDSDGYFRRVNPALAHVLGFAVEELVGKLALEYLHPEDRPGAEHVLRQLASGLPVNDLVNRIHCRDDSYRCILWVTASYEDRLYAAGRDITERMRAEETLQQERDFIAALIDTVGNLIVVLNRHGDIIRFNRACEQVTGYSFVEVKGRNGLDLLLAPEEAERVKAVFKDLCSGQFPNTHENYWVAKDGSHRLIAWSNTALLDAEGAVEYVIGTGMDITERKAAEDHLRAQKEVLEAIFDHIPLMISFYAEDGRIKLVNREWEHTRGWSLEEIQQQHVDVLAESYPDPQYRQQVRDFIATSKGKFADFHTKSRSGQVLDIAWAVVPLSDGTRVALGQDITERKQAEAALRESEERFRQLAESIDEVFWMSDPTSSRILYVSPAYEQIWGRTCQSVYEQPLSFVEAIHPDDRERLQGVLDSEKTEGTFETEYRVVRPDGTVSWIWDRGFPVRNEQGEVYRVVGIAQDITERKQAEAALQQAHNQLETRVEARTAELQQANEALYTAKERADDANRAKSEFLSRMSHEFRTPLSAILGFGQILDKQELDPLAKESVSYILNGGRHLLALINEVLDVAHVEAGRLELSLAPLALDDIVPEACALVRPLALARTIRLDENTQELGPKYLLADRQRLKQVLINLLGNAIKYNFEGGQVQVICDQGPEGWTTIAVRDSGPGISPEDLPKLFLPFERLKASTAEIEGTGLGLFLSQRLVKAMGGTLHVTSTLGRGTTFTIGLPPAPPPGVQIADLPEATRPLPPSSDPERTYSVLCIEDNPSSLRLLEVILQDRPEITRYTAMQGSIGLEMARQHEPDLILLDLDLPDIHGQEVLTRLRRSAVTRDIPVVVISADATPIQVERLLAAGASAYLTKPLDVDRTLQILDELLRVM